MKLKACFSAQRPSGYWGVLTAAGAFCPAAVQVPGGPHCTWCVLSSGHPGAGVPHCTWCILPSGRLGAEGGGPHRTWCVLPSGRPGAGGAGRSSPHWCVPGIASYMRAHVSDLSELLPFAWQYSVSTLGHGWKPRVSWSTVPSLC